MNSSMRLCLQHNVEKIFFPWQKEILDRQNHYIFIALGVPCLQLSFLHQLFLIKAADFVRNLRGMDSVSVTVHF